jgi:membrane-associated phospholipid phosphatase
MLSTRAVNHRSSRSSRSPFSLAAPSWPLIATALVPAPVVALVVVLVAALPAPASATNAFDREIFEFVRDHRSNGLDHLMKTASDEWSRQNMVLAFAAVAAWGDDRSFLAAQECIKSVALSEGVVTPLKYAVDRKRPTGTHSRTNASFPSSHAATGFAVAATIGDIYPEFKWPAYALASLVASSRVYNQRHYATDVLAGACIGVAAARASKAYLGRLRVDRRGVAARLPLRVAADSDGRGLVRIYLTRDI